MKDYMQNARKGKTRGPSGVVDLRATTGDAKKIVLCVSRK